MLWQTTYATTAAMLRQTLFGESTAFWDLLLSEKKADNAKVTPWENDRRRLAYTLPPKGDQGPTRVQVVERVAVDTDGMVVIRTKTHTPDVP
jgi:hypothetical protein